MTWTERHEKAIDRMLRRERRVRLDRQDYQLIQRLKVAMSYLRERKQNYPSMTEGVEERVQ